MIRDALWGTAIATGCGVVAFALAVVATRMTPDMWGALAVVATVWIMVIVVVECVHRKRKG